MTDPTSPPADGTAQTDEEKRDAALAAGWDGQGEVPEGHGSFVQPLNRFDSPEAAR